MNHSPLRRSLLLTAFTIPFVGVFTPLFASVYEEKRALLHEKLAKLEKSTDGCLGLSAFNMANEMQYGYRADERFAMCSTFKMMLVAAVLKKSMRDESLLQQRVTYKKEEVIVYSPIAEKHVASGMTLSELCNAAMIYSDNTAANLLMKVLGGPDAVNQFARSIGDSTFRLDRWEPELNSAIPNDLRDTTTPAAMEKSLRELVLGEALGKTQREQLTTWLKNNMTGNESIRAGVPKDWLVGDKTGGGSYGTTNDIAVLWPPIGAPIVVAMYFKQKNQRANSRKDVLASATRLLIEALN